MRRRGLDEDERALLAASRRDPVERRLLAVWRGWDSHPSTRPLWAAELQQHLAVGAQAPATGLADRGGVLPGSSARVLGMLLGGAVGEFAALGRVGQRTGALLFVLEGLIRAHTQLRTTGSGEPTSAAQAALRRWLHTRGVPWRDCGGDSPRPSGFLAAERELHDRVSDEPTMLTSVAAVVAGHPQGTRQHPVNGADGATAVPLGALAALWSDDPGAVFALGGDLAALTHGHPHGHCPAGVLGTAALWLLRGNDLETSLRQGVSVWQPGRTTLGDALRLGLLSPAGFEPGPAHLGSCRSGLGALAVAARVALACEDDFGAAIASAAGHDGDAASAAMLCGQLLGALRGPTAIPDDLLERLPIVAAIERLGRDAATEFGAEPDESAAWEERYPADDSATSAQSTSDYRTGLTGVARLASARDRFLGAVLGCAVGEAMGMPIASDTWDEIRARHGADGLTDYVPAGHPSGRIGSDTQLLLFSVEGVLRANIARRSGETDDPIRHLQHAYQRWLHTQHLSWPRAAGEFLREAPEADGWLVGQRALFQTRNPGRTMMRTLIAFAKGQQPMGTPEQSVSDSAGSGAIMRAIAAALWSDDPSEVFALGMRSAALTHGHPTALLSAGALGFLVSRLLVGEELSDAVTGVLAELAPHSGHEEVTRRLSAAGDLARGDRLSPDALERELGTGGTAPESLAIGLHAALAARGDFDAALPIAANHSGNSATTAAVAGALTAATTGASALPRRWAAELELHDVIDHLTRDALQEFGPRPPTWNTRYPPT